MYDKTILIRLQKKTADLLKKVARDRGEHISSFARRAIMTELGRLGFLDDEENKALGIPTLAGRDMKHHERQAQSSDRT
jgi:hypothetical protein